MNLKKRMAVKTPARNQNMSRTYTFFTMLSTTRVAEFIVLGFKGRVKINKSQAFLPYFWQQIFLHELA